jgi:hypothetical protein
VKSLYFDMLFHMIKSPIVIPLAVGFFTHGAYGARSLPAVASTAEQLKCQSAQLRGSNSW